MLASPPTKHQWLVQAQYVGDIDTGMVHLRGSNCGIGASELFLDLRTAMVRGYQLCRCCRRRAD